MRILQGTKQLEAPEGWRESVTGRRIVIDVGAGDGRWAYEHARSDGEAVWVAVDPAGDMLAQYAYRASRKPAKGGAANVLFVVASVEDLSAELEGIAALVRVNFPWGSLLRGLALPEAPVLEALARLGAADSRFEIVFSYDPVHDLAGLGGETLPPLSQQRIEEVLAPAYTAAGLNIEHSRQMSLDEAIKLPSTWARRLLHGRARDVFWLEGTISSRNAATSS